jgi:hypothetical protein
MQKRQKYRDRLRDEAVKARQDLKRASWINRRLTAKIVHPDKVSKADFTLITLLRHGELEKRRIAANKAYGHGKGTELTILPIEKIMTINASTRDLDAYFGR